MTPWKPTAGRLEQLPTTALGHRVQAGGGLAELVDQAAGYPATSAWLAGIRDDLTGQVGSRWLLPHHHSTAALDTALVRVRDFLDSRSFVLRNDTRTNVLLGLVRNHLNGRDLEGRYRAELRQIVEANEHTGAQRSAYDPRVDPRFPGRRYPGSLRV